MFSTLHERKNSKLEKIKERFRLGGDEEQYFGKGNKVIDQYNRRRSILARLKDNDEKFRKTKNKIQLVVYKNGFILNNGQFRDRSIKANEEFLDSVERGKIPQELIRKGIQDLGILLINRKTEVFRSKIYQSLPTSFNYLDISQDDYHNQTYNPDVAHPLDDFLKTPTGMRNERNNIGYSLTTRRFPIRLRENVERATSPRDRKVFVPFTGTGTLLANAKIVGKLIKEEKKTYVDRLSPMCEVNIVLSKGEFIKGYFNYCQTVRDIYQYVRRISNTNDFVLFDTFSSEPFLDYGKTIDELKLGETVIAQRMS